MTSPFVHFAIVKRVVNNEFLSRCFKFLVKLTKEGGATGVNGSKWQIYQKEIGNIKKT